MRKNNLKKADIGLDIDICRLNLKPYEYELLVNMLNRLRLKEDDFEEDGRFEGLKEFKETLFNKIENVIQIKNSNKRIATSKANEAKINKSKEKIENAINLLRMENKQPTAYSVAKIAGISYNTAKKYLKMFNIM